MLNPYIDARGIFHGIIIDIYDFDLLRITIEDIRHRKFLINFENNIAWLLQILRILYPYYIIVPIEFMY